MLDHVESQVSSAASDAGLGHASSPRGYYGATPGRFGGPRNRPLSREHTPGHINLSPTGRPGDTYAGDHLDGLTEADAPADVNTQERDES